MSDTHKEAYLTGWQHASIGMLDQECPYLKLSELGTAYMDGYNDARRAIPDLTEAMLFIGWLKRWLQSGLYVDPITYDMLWDSFQRNILKR